MVGGDERESCARKLDAAELDVPTEIDVVQVQEREEPRVRAPASQMRVEVHAAESLRQDVSDESAPPFVEVAEQNLRVRHAAIVNPRREPRSLVTTFEQRGPKMYTWS
jgi:hypothetical protein